MADDIENTAAEALAPPPPPGCGLCWAYAEDGRPVDAGSAFCTVEDELRFTCSDGPPFSLSYHDILSAEVTALELRLGLREGGFTLSKMGRLHDSFCAAFMERWTTVNRKQALSEEELVASFRGRARRNNGAALSCGVRVFATAIVLDFEDGNVFRLPLVFTGPPAEENLRFTFALPGETWVLSYFGRETDVFRKAVGDALIKLESAALLRIRALCPALPPFRQRSLVGLFLDGRAVALARARQASEELAAALTGSLGEAGLADSFAALCALPGAQSQSARIGDKAGLSPGAYRFFFLPVLREERAYIVFEAASTGDAGRATYVFRVPANGSPEAAMDALNYALILVNFRREPIYMSDAQLHKPENAHYLRSAERVPALTALRRDFAGRAAHTAPEAWLHAVEALLNG